METLNALDDIPAELVGVFDVVHVRTFTAVIRNNNPGPIIANAIKMLKSGGHLQWDEMDMGSLVAKRPNEATSGKAMQYLLEGCLLSMKETMGLKFDWISRLDEIFREHGLDIVDTFRLDATNDLLKPMTDNFLTGMEMMSCYVDGEGNMVGTKRNWVEMWSKAGEEINRGVTISMDMLVIVGRKT